jgi:hypothetical protein
MTKEQAFSIGLPKWPQCIIHGKKITEEQALEIIRRTDTFFESYLCGGNNKSFNEKARKICKIPQMSKDFETYHEWVNRDKKWTEKWKKISLNFLSNSWVSSAFIYGPHGWCHPDGTIEYHFNIGKWPEVEEIYDDLIILSEHFPFLEMDVTIMSKEWVEEENIPIITLRLKDGEITFIDDFLDVDLSFSTSNDKIVVFKGPKAENYFSLNQIQKWADQVFDGD